MILTEHISGSLQWYDCTEPSEEILIKTAQKLAVPENIFLNCLDPDYLPYIDIHKDLIFIMLRVCDLSADEKSESIQELTTKIAVFIKNNQIYTFHRLPLHEVTNTIEYFKMHSEQLDSANSIQFVLQKLFEQIAESYEQKLIELENNLDRFEEKILTLKNSKFLLKEGFSIKRKASAYKKVIKFTLDVLAKTNLKICPDSHQFNYVKEKFERYQFYADDVFENSQGLLNLHLAIQSQKTNEASYRTNEIVRVLTVLTIFFLPLNFIAGVYGMNFESMPLLKNNNGFWLAIASMGFISVGLLVYVIVKGWLKPPPRD